MKHCNACHATYSDRVDFCFNDGMVLVGSARAISVYGGSGLDLPPPRGLRGDDTDGPALPRARRRSLLGGQPVAVSETSVPVDAPLAPVAPLADAAAYTPPDALWAPPALPWIDPPAARFAPAETRATDLDDDEGDEPVEVGALVTPAPITDTPPPVRTRGSTPAPALVAQAPGAELDELDELPPLDAEDTPAPGRPAWMLPAIVGGALAVALIVGLGALALGGAALVGTRGVSPEPAAVLPHEPPPEPVGPPEAPPAAAVVVVRLGSVPSGAEVTVDGVSEGPAPVNLELEPGPHTVRFVLAQFVTLEQTVDVGPDAAPLAPFVLVAEAAAPEPVVPEPVVPEPLVVAPPVVPPPAPHRVKPPVAPPPPVNPTEPPSAWTFQPPPVVTKPPTALPPAIRVGRVLVTGTGTLTVDGDLIGPLPASVKLTEGKHQFTVSTDGRADTTVTRDVTFGENGRAVLQL